MVVDLWIRINLVFHIIIMSAKLTDYHEMISNYHGVISTTPMAHLRVTKSLIRSLGMVRPLPMAKNG